MKERIAKWFKFNLWTEEMVKTAADKGVITEEDYKEICGK